MAAVNAWRRALFLAARFRPRRKAEIEISRLERVLVLAQRRIIRRRRHRKAGGQPAVEQARAFELVEPRQVGQRLQSEMRQELLGGAIGERPAGRLAAAARADPAGLQEYIDRTL